MSLPRTPGQNSKIHALLGEIRGLSELSAEETRHCYLTPILQEVSQQDRTSTLTSFQAKLVIEKLNARLVELRKQKPTTAPPPDPRERARITDRQQATLCGLYPLAGFTTPEQQQGFSRRQCKKPWPQTQEDFDAIFEALSAIALRKISPSDFWARVRAAKARDEETGAFARDDYKRDWLRDVDGRFARASNLADVPTAGRLAKLLDIEAALEAALEGA